MIVLNGRDEMVEREGGRGGGFNVLKVCQVALRCQPPAPPSGFHGLPVSYLHITQCNNGDTSFVTSSET